MAPITVIFILAVLKVNIIWTREILSNVYERLTPEEKIQIFGTDNSSVPDYQVLPMIIPGANRSRRDDDRIYLGVEIDGTRVGLHLSPATGYLATKYTPVWLAVTDQRAYNKIWYHPLPNAMTNIGQFRMYQDVSNAAALVLYLDPHYGIIVEGSLASGYIIRSLPERFTDQSPGVGNDNVNETEWLQKRSIERDAGDVTSYCVVFKSPSPAKNAERNVYRHVESRQRRSQRRKRMMPIAVYPEILLVLDHNVIRNHTITQALRFVLAFWNSVDMVYSSLDEPRIHLNIAGIIISADDAATPYIARDTSIKIKQGAYNILRKLDSYFEKEQVRFPLRIFDMIFAMTPIQLCAGEADGCAALLGFASLRGACSFRKGDNANETTDGVAVVHYDWMFGGLETAVHESAHLFGVDHDVGNGSTAACHWREGFAMSPTTNFVERVLQWSLCSKIFFRDFFSSTESLCLHNVPISIRPVKDMLPGRWLTLDGQCRNNGFHKSCRVPDSPICMIKGCRNRNSNICVTSEHSPLPGTKCGENKYCNLEGECVNE